MVGDYMTVITATPGTGAAEEEPAPASIAGPSRRTPMRALVDDDGASLRVIDGVAIGILGLVALAGFATSYGTIAPLVGMIGMVPVLVWTSVAIARNWSPWSILAAAIVVYLAVAAVVVTPLTSILSGIVTGWSDALATQPPIGQLGDLLAVPLACGVVIAAVSPPLVQWRPAFALVGALPSLAVFIAAIFVGTNSPAFVGQGVVFLLVAASWAAYRQRRLRSMRTDGAAVTGRPLVALAMLFVAAMVGLIIGSWAPVSGSGHRSVVRDRTVPPVEPSFLSSPLSEYRHFHVDLASKPLITVSGLQSGQLVTLASLDDYNGIDWGIDPSDSPSDPGAIFERVGSQLSDGGGAAERTATIQVDGYRDVWVPLTGDAVSVTFGGQRSSTLATALRYNRVQGMGGEVDNLTSGDRWVETYVSGTAGSGTASEPPALDVTPKVAAWIAKNTPSGADKLAQISALSASLTQSGDYSDGQPGQLASLAGSDEQRLTTFLSNANPVGDAEQSTAALALMARQIGLPSAVDVGFRAPSSGSVTFDGKDLVAWDEVEVAGSWHAFFPTATKPKSVPPPPTQNTPYNNALERTPPPPPTALHHGRQRGHSGSTSGCPNGDCGGFFSVPTWAVATVGIPLILTLLLVAVTGVLIGIKSIRRKRRRSEGTPAARVAGGWSEVSDLLRDLGSVLPDAATRRECAVLADRPGVSSVAESADSLIFGPQQVSEPVAATFWEQVEVTRTGLLGSLTRFERWQARVSLSSLRLDHPVRILWERAPWKRSR